MLSLFSCVFKKNSDFHFNRFHSRCVCKWEEPVEHCEHVGGAIFVSFDYVMKSDEGGAKTDESHRLQMLVIIHLKTWKLTVKL